ncbi:hypothetical protein BE17_44355 [Sorangium cellulosum]|uniref:Uncharacterized protein n=1 Tax=Sorangium cellulosum TaxID=56 RepID=A0A150RL09_SORCE|nr:hypothetical protein BE17_44355 [Sorangium cellulosum]
MIDEHEVLIILTVASPLDERSAVALGRYEFLFRITSRVRHHQRFCPDSARWATHYLDICYDKPSGGTLT